MESSTRDELINKIDQLQSERKVTQVFQLLSCSASQFPDDPQIVWRFARAYFEMAEEKPKDSNWTKDHYNQGLLLAEKALTLDNNHFAIHCWYGILLGSVSENLPPKEKLANAGKIKEHANKALELKNDDPTTLQLLGKWCFNVAGISWIERKLASTLFGTPPESSYEEALEYFLRAVELAPTFLPLLACVGDCYYQIKQYENAKTFYQKVIDLPGVAEGDKFHQHEAKTKLAKLK